jgi:hypothetical protein
MKTAIIFSLLAVYALNGQKNKIVYNKISDSLNIVYGKMVAQEIRDPSFLLYEKPFFVGPEVYEMMLKDNFKLDNCTNTTYVIDDLKLPGKLTKDSSDYFAVWSYFLKNIDCIQHRRTHIDCRVKRT